MSRRTWTVERDALFRAELPDNTDPRALLAKLNALPGDPVTSVRAMVLYANRLGLRRNPEAERAVLSAAGRVGRAKQIAAAGGNPITVWTAERNARLIAGRAASERTEVTLAALNEIPGIPVASVAALRRQATKIHAPHLPSGPPPGTMPKFIPSKRKASMPSLPPPQPAPKRALPGAVVVREPDVAAPILPPSIPPTPSPALADAAAAARTARVMDAIRRSMKAGRLSWESAVAIASRNGVTPQRVLVLVGLMR